jgi:hypothetical protein
MNSNDLEARCVAFLNKSGRVQDWDGMIAACEEGRADAIELTFRLIREHETCSVLGALAAGPLWEILESDSPLVPRLIDEAMRGDRHFRQCLSAIDRYSKKAFTLQTLVSRVSQCEAVPEALRPMRHQGVIDEVVGSGKDDGCVRLCNVYSNEFPETDRAGADEVRAWVRQYHVGDRDTVSRLAQTRPGAACQVAVALPDTFVNHEQHEAFAVELDGLLLRWEISALPFVVSAITASPKFVCCLSYTVFVGLSELAIDVLLSVIQGMALRHQQQL